MLSLTFEWSSRKLCFDKEITYMKATIKKSLGSLQTKQPHFEGFWKVPSLQIRKHLNGSHKENLKKKQITITTTQGKKKQKQKKPNK